MKNALLAGFVAFALMLIVPTVAIAGWLTWVGVGISVVGAVGATVASGGTATVIAGVALVGEVGALIGDIAISTNAVASNSDLEPGDGELSLFDDQFALDEDGKLRFAASDTLGPYLGTIGMEYYDELVSAQFPFLEAPNSEVEPLVSATNAYISAVNSMKFAAATGESHQILASECWNLGDRIEAIRIEINALGFGELQFSTNQLQDGLDEIMTNGLPEFEQNFLSQAGFSDGFISELTALHGLADVNALSNWSLSDLFEELRDHHYSLSCDLMLATQAE